MLFLLVGENPLPNYLSALALKPDQLILVHSRETGQVAERLECLLKKGFGYGAVIKREAVSDASSAQEVRCRLEQLMQQYHAGKISLNYTGGTKVMAANALHAFYKTGGRSEDASYLEDGGPGRHPRLRFDDGRIRTLAECRTPNLTLEAVLELHGYRLQRRGPKQPAPTPADVSEIAKAVLAQPELAGRLHEAVNSAFRDGDDPKKFLDSPFDPQVHRLQLSIGKFPTEEQIRGMIPGQRKSWFRQWRRFIGGCWFEDWITARIAETGLVDDGCELDSGFQVFRQTSGDEKQAQLEIDVALVRNYRSYFISCTTADRKAICKQKLFEIAVRSRQLAGDLARPAVVCLADGKTLGELCGEVDDEPSPDERFRVRGIGSVHVFGLEDLRAWSGWQGSPRTWRR
ncbi:MAG: hypothetical protein ACP5U2_14095 [Bryobacteraceae bacterium]